MRLSSEHVQRLREQFPALARSQHGQQVVHLDGPAGTQVPQCVVDAMSQYLLQCNANKGGVFASSRQSDQWLGDAHQALADFVGAREGAEIAFGLNMTSLTLALSRSLARLWRPGDEIVVTRLDHDANITPWVLAAQDSGVTVRYVDFRHDDCTLDLEMLARQLCPQTRLVAVGWASNASGGINPVEQICRMAHQAGALAFVDAVHYAPHGLIDVQQCGCDFLVCSAYKFFGPHLGVLWGRRELLEQVPAYKVRPAPDELPEKWMNGTQSHEAIVGAMAAVDYLAQIGRQLADDPSLVRRTALQAAFAGITQYEQSLSQRLLEGFARIPGLRVHGPGCLQRLDQRVPTFSITHPAIRTPQLARELAEQGIFVWDGNYYALQFSEQLGLQPDGMIRVGAVHYNTHLEIARLLDVLHDTISDNARGRPHATRAS